LLVTYIRVIKDMYKGASTSVRTQDEATDDFLVIIGMHQGQP